MPMLSIGTFALIAVVGAAIFGGFDPRSKKKEINGGAEPDPIPSDPDELLDCAALVDWNANGTQVTLDGGPSVPADVFVQDLVTDVGTSGNPVILLFLWHPDPLVLGVVEELCVQRPEITFMASYVARLELGILRTEADQREDMVASATVFSSTEPGLAAIYDPSSIPELELHVGDDVALWVATLLSFTEGAHHDAVVLEETG